MVNLLFSILTLSITLCPFIQRSVSFSLTFSRWETALRMGTFLFPFFSWTYWHSMDSFSHLFFFFFWCVSSIKNIYKFPKLVTGQVEIWPSTNRLKDLEFIKSTDTTKFHGIKISSYHRMAVTSAITHKGICKGWGKSRDITSA